MNKKKRFLLVLLLLLVNISAGYYLYGRYFSKPGYEPRKELPAIAFEEPAVAPPVESSPAGNQPLATLVEIERNVNSKRAVESEWGAAELNMQLYENDAIRTLLNSSAVLRFGEEEDEIVIDSNTFFVVKLPHEGTAEREISVAVLPTTFLDKLAKVPASERARLLEQEIAKRRITLRPVRKAGEKSVKTRSLVKILPDLTTRVQAVGGPIKIIGTKGDEVTLQNNMVTRLTKTGGLASPRPPLGVPKALEPSDGKKIVFQSKIPRVKLRWSEVKRAWRYRVVIARDARFRSIFADEVVNGTSFTVMNLSEGTYYWRVSARESDGFISDYSASRSIRTFFDDKPPVLSIQYPPEMFVSPHAQVELRGKTEGGVRVKVNGQKVTVAPDGSFEHTLSLKEGVNLVTIEASDQVGNRTYGKRLVTYKGMKRSRPVPTSSRP
ncbi:MAG: hypothetical protein V3U86_12885 [Acidobacteriota bacterium]